MSVRPDKISAMLHVARRGVKRGSGRPPILAGRTWRWSFDRSEKRFRAREKKIAKALTVRGIARAFGPTFRSGPHGAIPIPDHRRDP